MTRRRKEANQNGLSQILERFHNFAAGCARGLHSATKLAGPEGATAQATAEVKRDAKAVAAGTSEGWSRDKPLDLNTATKERLLSLPGVTAAEADRVIAGRPYNEAKW